MITLNPLLLTLLIGAIIPLVVALITKATLDNRWKAIITMVLAAISGTLVTINDQGGTFEWKQAVVATAATAITSIATYLGFWAPAVDPNTKLAPQFGLGSDPQV